MHLKKNFPTENLPSARNLLEHASGLQLPHLKPIPLRHESFVDPQAPIYVSFARLLRSSCVPHEEHSQQFPYKYSTKGKKAFKNILRAREQFHAAKTIWRIKQVIGNTKYLLSRMNCTFQQFRWDRRPMKTLHVLNLNCQRVGGLSPPTTKTAQRVLSFKMWRNESLFCWIAARDISFLPIQIQKTF